MKIKNTKIQLGRGEPFVGGKAIPILGRVGIKEKLGEGDFFLQPLDLSLSASTRSLLWLRSRKIYWYTKLWSTNLCTSDFIIIFAPE